MTVIGDIMTNSEIFWFFLGYVGGGISLLAAGKISIQELGVYVIGVSIGFAMFIISVIDCRARRRRRIERANNEM